jgi:hypothetical protein
VSAQKKLMRFFSGLCVILAICSCSGDVNMPQKGYREKVEIYELKSFTIGIDSSYRPYVTVIKNIVLEDTPLIRDQEISSYTKSSFTFELTINLNPVIKNYGAGKAFAVTVDKKIIYTGLFRPAYLSSIVFSVPSIDPLSATNSLTIELATITGAGYIQPIDKRNDFVLMNALNISGRLK